MDSERQKHVSTNSLHNTSWTFLLAPPYVSPQCSDFFVSLLQDRFTDVGLFPHEHYCSDWEASLVWLPQQCPSCSWFLIIPAEVLGPMCSVSGRKKAVALQCLCCIAQHPRMHHRGWAPLIQWTTTYPAPLPSAMSILIICTWVFSTCTQH